MTVSILKGTKNVKQAAEMIGVTDRCLRNWIKNFYERCPGGRGTPGNCECKAEKIEDEMFPAGYIWQVPLEEIIRLRDAERSGPGRPRLSDSA